MGDEWDSRLRQMWRAAMEMHVIVPTLSQSIIVSMMRICEEKEIRIANDFYKNVCSCCGTIWIPGVNCRVRIRNPDNSGVRSKKHALRMSSTMFDGNSVTKKNYRLDPSNSSNIILLVYHCKVCKRNSLFDVDETPPKPSTLEEPILTMPLKNLNAGSSVEDRKLAKLKKILSRGAIGSFLASTKKS